MAPDLLHLATAKAAALVEAQAAAAEYRAVIRLSRTQRIIDRYRRAYVVACARATHLEDAYREAIAP